MKEFESSDFKRMMLNVYDLPKTKQVMDVFTPLQEYPEFNVLLKNLEEFRDNVIRYIFFMYDKDSPLHDRIQDYVERKVTAAQLAGFKASKKGEFKKKVQEMLQCKDEAVNDMIVRFCVQQRPTAYSHYIIGQELYVNQLKEIASDKERGKLAAKNSLDDAKIKHDLWMKAGEMVQAQDAKKRLIMQYDDNELLCDKFYKVAEEEVKQKYMISPEDHAYNNA